MRNRSGELILTEFLREADYSNIQFVTKRLGIKLDHFEDKEIVKAAHQENIKQVIYSSRCYQFFKGVT